MAEAASGPAAGPRLRGAVFDFGGVLTEPLFRRPRGVPEDILAFSLWFVQELQEVYPATTGEHDFHLLETGRMSEEEFFRRACRRYAEAGNADLDPLAVREAVLSRGIAPSPPMVDAVRRVHDAGVRTALLTNNVREWEPRWRPLVPLDELFDVVVDSSAVGLRKPDPAIYRLTCDRLGVPPEDCLFVDDMPCNIDAAQALGMETLLVARPEQSAPEVLRRLLGGDGAGAREQP